MFCIVHKNLEKFISDYMFEKKTDYIFIMVKMHYEALICHIDHFYKSYRCTKHKGGKYITPH